MKRQTEGSEQSRGVKRSKPGELPLGKPNAPSCSNTTSPANSSSAAPSLPCTGSAALEWTKMPPAQSDSWQIAVEKEFASEQFKSEMLNGALLFDKGRPAQKQRHALVVLGPSASGKTHGLCHNLESLPALSSWVKHSCVLDGACFRDHSKVWAEVKASALRDGYCGYSDAYTTLMKAPTDKLKGSLVEKLTEAGVNVIVPDTCSKISIVNEKIKMLVDAGYSISILACVAPKSICEGRGRARESAEGKKYSSKNWEASTVAIETVVNGLREGGAESEFYVLHTARAKASTADAAASTADAAGSRSGSGAESGSGAAAEAGGGAAEGTAADAGKGSSASSASTSPSTSTSEGRLVTRTIVIRKGERVRVRVIGGESVEVEVEEGRRTEKEEKKTPPQ